MQKTQRIPLEKRLQAAAVLQKEGWPISACKLYLDTYFYTLSDMAGDTCYMDFYVRAETTRAYGDVGNAFIAREMLEALSCVYDFRMAEVMLYEILIRPFADERIFREKGENT